MRNNCIQNSLYCYLLVTSGITWYVCENEKNFYFELI